MGMNFPNSPTPGQIYAPPGGPVYRYDDPIWTAVAGAGVPLEGVPEAPVDGTQYGRQDAAWTPVTGGGGGGSMTAAEILTAIKTVDGADSGLDADLLDGQSSAAFAVASHTHAYSSLTSIPSTFAPSAHNHPQSEITNLVTDQSAQDTAIAGKAPTVHTHAYSSLTSIPSTFAPSAHSHPTSEVTGLDTALTGKVAKAGDTMTGKLNLATPTATDAMLNLSVVGTAPSAPVEGDLWYSNGFVGVRTGSAARNLVDNGTTQNIAGLKTFTVALTANAGLKVQATTAIPAGGTAGAGYTLSSATNFGVFFGSGAPTLSAAQGSIYLRSDGTGTNTRVYVNTNGTTGWAAMSVIATGTTAPSSPATNDVWIDTT
jgi:hypothetical protein